MKGNIFRIACLAMVVVGLFLSFIPVEAAAPDVQTLKVRGFGSDWLELTGNVTGYGGVVNITLLAFLYGTTPYTSSINVPIPSGNYTMTSYGYYSYISGLKSQTMYQWAAAASNGALGVGAQRQFSTAGSSVINSMEWGGNVGAINTTQSVYGANWATQSFTTNDTAHTITGIDLWLNRFNNIVGDVTVVLQQSASGIPYGTPLATGTIPAQYTGNINPVSTNTTTRYTIPMTPEVSLSANTQYSITIKATMGSPDNYLNVANINTGSYAWGIGSFSTNNGLTWTDTGTDFLFDLWGHACMQVDQARVFNTYKNAGDWLVVFFYRNTFPPYYPVQDSKQYFVYQLVDAYNNVLAQQSCSAWGAKPGSIYLSASSVVPLSWSGAYRVRLTNLRDGTVYMEYPLQSADWLGTDLSLLDSWVISMAQSLQSYDNVPYIVPVAGRGNVLNSAGGVIFATGIPLLDSVRPNLFQVVSTPSSFTTSLYPQNMRTKYTPVLMLGTDAWATMVSIGNVFGVDGRTVGGAGILLICVVIAGWGFQPGHNVAATVISFPIVILGLLTGLIDILIGALVLAIVVLIFIWKSIFQGG